MSKYELVAIPGLKLYREDFKTNLLYLRNDKRLTQSKLSELSGVNVRLIQDYEQGHKSINNAKSITVYKLAEALGCKMENLLEL